ncbi:hypothetical protein HJFPF1_08860 [Paramyrothecium foliicola]|nr:hypothetical protein HJFPF1_08860 [Paramyrothecium foliicola]
MAGTLTRQPYRWATGISCFGKVSCRTFATLPIASSFAPVDLDAFRRDVFLPERLFHFKNNTTVNTEDKLPAATKWFDDGLRTFSPYMQEFYEWPFPYELIVPSPDSRKAVAAFRDWLLQSSEVMDPILAGVIEPVLAEADRRTFHQLYAPLKLLHKALEFNKIQRSSSSSSSGPQALMQLYIAQSLLSDLPDALLKDLPTPDIVLHAGKGDVYSSSIWLGTEPTYTPLHRDPNPNLFCQLHSSKVLRLLPPTLGEKLFFQVQARIRQQANSRIRNVQMMEGKEREELHRAVWQPDEPLEGLHEVAVQPGDALYIPKGWWHSVKSLGSGGGLNASANWWFR